MKSWSPTNQPTNQQLTSSQPQYEKKERRRREEDALNKSKLSSYAVAVVLRFILVVSFCDLYIVAETTV